MAKRSFDSMEDELYDSFDQPNTPDRVFPPSPPDELNELPITIATPSLYSTSTSSSSSLSITSKKSLEVQANVILTSPKKTRNFHIDLTRFLVRGSPLTFSVNESATLYRPFETLPVRISLSSMISQQEPRIILFFPGMNSERQMNELPIDVLQLPIVRKLGCIVSSSPYRPITPPLVSKSTELRYETGRPSQKVIPELFDEKGHLARACRVLDPLGGGCVPIPSIIYIDNRHIKVVIPFQCVQPSQLREIVTQMVEL